MFVSVVLDPGGIDSARSLVSVLVHSGYKKIQRACCERMNVTETELTELKKEIDRITDYYDTVRIYQFPLNGMFVITELKQKRWKRCQLRSDSENKPKQGSLQQRASAARQASSSNASLHQPARSVAQRTSGTQRQTARTAPRGTMHKQ